ncbi:hypothetical protein LTR17_005226 [Elasticomyces elasticus]|nr:hypothetical protein LTR17_005226 [Elasticomyces elasticus]
MTRAQQMVVALHVSHPHYLHLSQLHVYTQNSSSQTMGNKQERSKAKKRKYRHRHKCRLLLLPAELRIRIYELAVTKPSRVVGCCRNISMNRNLSATCQQIRRECVPIFYGDNTFCFKSSNIHVSPEMKHFEIAQCSHYNTNYYTLDVNLPDGGYKLEMVCRPNRRYDPYDESAESYCRVNPATLADGRRMLDGLFKGEKLVLGAKEMRGLLVVLDSGVQNHGPISTATTSM